MTVLAAEESGEDMLAHYGVGNGEIHRRWRTVTRAALPDGAARRRIDPDRRLEEVKSGPERVSECALAGGAVVQALRPAGVSARAQAIRVQCEPFESKGERAELFAKGTRFLSTAFGMSELFSDEIVGPLVIGDGRFLGLGILAPCSGGFLARQVISGSADSSTSPHPTMTKMMSCRLERGASEVSPRAAQEPETLGRCRAGYYQGMSWPDRIAVDPEVLAGKPVIRGTRLAVEFVLDLLAAGQSEVDIVANYPGLAHEDILACLAYASHLAHEYKAYPLPV